ncbi:MAG: hypothetical protein JJT96_18370 [Opitutales bacterium]|nr:hypothetical protein [Opitutales bacterium]
MKSSSLLPLLALGLFSLPGPVHANGLDAFLGAESFNLQKLWDGPGGTSVVVAKDGSVLAFEGTSGNRVLRSTNGGTTWSTPITIGSNALNGNALVDEVSGNVLYVNPALNALWRSSNHGQSWTQQTITIEADGLGNPGLDVRYMQAGITLQNVSWPPYGSDQRGRLIMPARILGPENSDAPDWRIYHYATSIFSDDGGASWVTSIPFPIMGAADGAIAELSYDGLVFSAREQITRGNRYIGTSPNNGLNWIAADRNADIPDGPRGSTFGLMGGLIRVPVAGYDILLYSNVDTDAGSLPAEFAGDSTDGRERVTVWASFDGGQTWPLKRLVYDGPGGISSLAAGRAGTASAGKIFLLFEGGPAGSDSAVHLATFNLSWLLDGADIEDYLIELVEPEPFPAIYWTGQGNRFGGQSNAWSSVAFDDPDYPVYTTVSSGESYRFYYDLAGMIGSTSTVRMNRDDVTMISLNLAGIGSSGFAFTNVDNNGSGLMLAGPVRVLSGIHSFFTPSPGRTIELMTDSTWTIAQDAALLFNHVLSGERGITKTGPGTLRITGNQLYTGETSVERGVFGVGSGPASLAGSLYFEPEGLLRFDPAHTLTVAGSVTFEERFGINNLDGLNASVVPGTYHLIAGNVEPANLENVGLNRAAPIGPGKWAYFGTEGGLTVTVVDAIPEPPTLSLQWIGFDANRPVLELDGPAGAAFTIEGSMDLIDWADLDTLVPAETPVQWMDPEALTEDPRFYRMRLGDGENGN